MADRPGYGFLYPTPREQRTKTSPVLTGSLVTKSGEVIELAAWKKTARNGTEYLSIKHADEHDPREADSDIPD